MQKLYELKTDEAGNAYIEWEYAGDTYKVVKFANEFKFLKRFETQELFVAFDSTPSTDGKKELDWDTAFYYGTILMEDTAFERMLQVRDFIMSKPESLYSVLERWRDDKSVPLEEKAMEYIRYHLRERSGLLCDDWYVDELVRHIVAYPMMGYVWFKTSRVIMPIALPESNSVLDVYIETADEMNDGAYDVEIRMYLEECGTGSSLCLGGADVSSVNWVAVMTVLDEYRRHVQLASGVTDGNV